jgi:CTP synthase (UTP-ammonia lyase)
LLDAKFAQNRPTVKIAMVGKYMNLLDAYKSLNEALKHAGLQTLSSVEIDYIDAEQIEEHGTAVLEQADAFWCQEALVTVASRAR